MDYHFAIILFVLHYKMKAHFKNPLVENLKCASKSAILSYKMSLYGFQ